MNGEAPLFVQLPQGSTPFLREFAATLFWIILVTWVGLPAFFAPPTPPIHMRPLALPGQSCQAWDGIIYGRSRLSNFWASAFRDSGMIVEECAQLGVADPTPIQNPQEYIRPDGIAVLDPSRSECGSDEARNAAERYYLIQCSPNPATFNALSWTHEGWHLALGHTALRHTFFRALYALPEPVYSYAKGALNAFLDTAYVEPAGNRGATWFRTAVLIGALLLRLRHASLRGLGPSTTQR